MKNVIRRALIGVGGASKVGNTLYACYRLIEEAALRQPTTTEV